MFIDSPIIVGFFPMFQDDTSLALMVCQYSVCPGWCYCILLSCDCLVIVLWLSCQGHMFITINHFSLYTNTQINFVTLKILGYTDSDQKCVWSECEKGKDFVDKSSGLLECMVKV